MKSAIIFALAIVPALTGLLEAAEPPGVLQVASALRETLPPEPVAKKPAGPPIGIQFRVYEMDTEKLGPDLEFRPQKGVRKTINEQFEAFRKAGFVRVLSAPLLVTLDGRTATFLSGGESPALFSSDEETTKIDWLEFGTRVEVTPRRAKRDQVQIKLTAEFSRLAEDGLASEGRTYPVVVGRSFRTAFTLGPKDVVVLNDRETRESDASGKVVFMTIELADVGVESALLQFDEADLPDSPSKVLPVSPRPSVDSSKPFASEDAIELRTGAVGTARNTTAASSAGSFYLKPGKTQLELTRGTWRSLTIPSKDFDYGSSLLVESPEDGAISISGRIMTPQAAGAAKTDSFAAGDAGEKYAADIWTIKALKAGVATIRLLDDDEREYEIEVTVKGDTRHFDAMVKRFHPKAKVEAHELTEQSIVITGEATPEDAVAIQEIAEQLYETVLLRMKSHQPIATEPQDSLGSSRYLPPTDEPAGYGPDGPPGSVATTQRLPTDASGPVLPDPNADYEPASDHTVIRKPRPAIDIAVPFKATDEENGNTFHFDVGILDSRPASKVSPIVGFDVAAVSQPTTQVRFLHTGFISMQTPAESGGFARVQTWDTWQMRKKISGQFQYIRYNAHRENVPTGSQTRFQFRTTEFRDDVWVNAVLVTTAANEETRYFLQHFPVDLILDDHEVKVAARGELVSRFVVMKDPRSVSVPNKQGETEEIRESFTGPNSFQEAVAEGRKHGQLLAVLVLGPESKLKRPYVIPQPTAGDPYGQSNPYGEPNPYAEPLNPYGQNGKYTRPTRVEIPAIPVGSPVGSPGIPDVDTGDLKPQPAGSVSTEMRQLRQEVRSLREQLGKLVEVLSREHQPKPELITPDPFGRKIEIGPAKRPVPIPPPTIEDDSYSKQPRPGKLVNPFEPSVGDESSTDDPDPATPASNPRPVPDPGTGSRAAESGGVGADRPAEAIPPVENSPALDSPGR